MQDKKIFSGRLFKTEKNQSAVALIILLLLLMMGLLAAIALSEDKRVVYGAIAGLVVLVIVIAYNRRLTLNEADDRNIGISREGIAIGMDRYDWPLITKLGIYVEAYYGFRYRVGRWKGRNAFESSYGMDNWIYFRVGEEKHTYRFLVPNHEAYFLLEDILDEWKREGRSFAWKEAYGRAFIENELKASGVIA
jgi:hypothetical protein